MSSFQAFDDLITSLQDAVIKSQELTQNQHLALMNKYFDENGNPLMLKIKVPNMNVNQDKPVSSENNNYRIIEIPAFCLIPQNSLSMKKVKMNFDVNLVDFGKNGYDNNNQDADKSENKSDKNLNHKVLGNLLFKRNNKKKIITNIFNNSDEANSIHVEIEFISKEAPEGLMRINDMMIRMIP